MYQEKVEVHSQERRDCYTKGHIRQDYQITVNNYNKFGGVVEGLAWIAELICRHAVLKDLYLRQTSKATEEL
ncbi:hypothetical protein V2W45_675296 [Cenococcum geophilum]